MSVEFTLNGGRYSRLHCVRADSPYYRSTVPTETNITAKRLRMRTFVAVISAFVVVL